MESDKVGALPKKDIDNQAERAPKHVEPAWTQQFQSKSSPLVQLKNLQKEVIPKEALSKPVYTRVSKLEEENMQYLKKGGNISRKKPLLKPYSAENETPIFLRRTTFRPSSLSFLKETENFHRKENGVVNSEAQSIAADKGEEPVRFERGTTISPDILEIESLSPLKVGNVIQF
jgi:hypothetical protein